MRYKDYYAILGVDRTAGADEIRKAYRRLAQKHHPDVSKEAGAEERFKEIAEAYDTLKNPEKRAAYDQLGRYQPGQDFQPPPGWANRFGDEHYTFEDVDLGDLFAGLAGAGRRGAGAFRMPGQDYEVTARISLEDAFHGTEIEVKLAVPQIDSAGRPHTIPRTLRVRVPKGATDGQRLRIAGKGGKGRNGGRDGDLYLNITLAPHPLFRVSGHDLYLDLPLAPWEAVLGATVEVPTLSGPVHLRIPAGTRAGQQLRLARRGLPRPKGGEGNLHAIVQLVTPADVTDEERDLYGRLATVSRFDPRGHFPKETRNGR